MKCLYLCQSFYILDWRLYIIVYSLFCCRITHQREYLPILYVDELSNRIRDIVVRHTFQVRVNIVLTKFVHAVVGSKHLTEPFVLLLWHMCCCMQHSLEEQHIVAQYRWSHSCCCCTVQMEPFVLLLHSLDGTIHVVVAQYIWNHSCCCCTFQI